MTALPSHDDGSPPLRSRREPVATAQRASLKAIAQEGASARARGLTRFDNPYDDARAMPPQTGEDVDNWYAKFMAWECGWRNGV